MFSFIREKGLNEILSEIFQETQQANPPNVYDFVLDFLHRKQTKVIFLAGYCQDKMVEFIRDNLRKQEFEAYDFKADL